MVAERVVLLDHLTRGRLLLGIGAGGLISDAHMLGVDSTKQRERTDEALGIIVRLFTELEPITYKSDWFELNEAILQVRPYQRPHMPLAVGSVVSPSGVALAGKYGAAVLSIGAPPKTVAGSVTLTDLWAIAEESAAKHGKRVRREDWRLAIPIFLGDSKEEAYKDALAGAKRYVTGYLGETLGYPKPDYPLDQVIDQMVDAGKWIVGSPDDCIEAIYRLDENTGGFGGLLMQMYDWSTREKVLHSCELLARYVMPHFQGDTRRLNQIIRLGNGASVRTPGSPCAGRN